MNTDDGVPSTPDPAGAVDAVWKLESARIIAGLARMTRDIGLAEELAQDALVSALEQWPRSGVPDNPGAWLMAVAKRRAVDHLRREQRAARGQELLAHDQREQLRTARFDAPDPYDETNPYDAPDPYDAPGPDPRNDLRATPGTDPETDQGTHPGTSHETGHETGHATGPETDARDDDNVLRLMFLSCHPVLPTEERVALTLRLLGGLTAEEIGRAFLVTGTVTARRIADAKRTLAERRVPFELPQGDELAARLSSVLEVIYLIFNEGYSATTGDDLLRPGLTLEALRLARLLAALAPDEPEAHGLAALLEIQESRSAARTGPTGEPVPLHEQQRGRWDPLLIRRGFASMLRARDLGRTPGPYVLQAAIAVTHAQARTAGDTDWAGIAALYEALVRLLPTPVVRLNRAVAVGFARGPEAGLALVDELDADPRLKDYHLLPGVRGDLLSRLGRHTEARREFERAASLTRNTAERAFLLRRADALAAAVSWTAAHPGPPAPPDPRALGRAAEEFLARDDLDPATVRSYHQTLRRLRLALGDRLPLTELTAERAERVFTTAWGEASPATWNRHRSALRSFAAWAGLDDDPAAGLTRRTPTAFRTPSLDPAGLEALWALPGVPPRERLLWRLLHESGAPVKRVLALDVERLDLDDRRARSGDTWVSWRAGTALLLPAHLKGRTRGPLFLTDRRPGPARRAAGADLDPVTGLARLSYERAEHLFKRTTRPLDPAGTGWTLSRLRTRRD
ncbi:DUF6596 domain-containing protein [Streptomyces uncialis]|uniref:DUF6596 domain-containing protein n=1 Tax=Streptomyces uncialis TaxID=1048205 RepID=UPI0037A9E8EC